MTLTINLSAATEAKLAEQAAAAGKTPAEVVTELVEEKYARPRPWRQIAAPIAADFAASGMTEEELDAVVEQAREAAHQARHGAASNAT